MQLAHETTTGVSKLLVVVTGCHLLLILIVMISGLFHFRPTLPDTIKVNLVSLPTPPSADPISVTPPTPNPVEPEVKQPDPPPVKPEVKQPDPPPVKPEVKQPDPPPVRAQVNKPDPTPTPRPQPRWKANSAEDILKRLRELPKKQPPTVTPVPSVNPNAIARRIRQSMPRINVSAPLSAPADAPSNTASVQRYYDAVGAEFYRLWQQPSRSEAPGNPQVTISIVAARDGEVITKRIVRPSKVAAMNATVSRALHALTRLPALSTFGIDRDSLEIRVDFELEN